MDNNKYKIAIEALKDREEELLSEISGIRSSIVALENRIGVSHTNSAMSKSLEKSEKPTKDEGYDPNWSISNKFGYLLNKYKRFLHFREAAEMINEIEGINYDISDLTKKLSSGTQSLKGKGKIVKKKIDSNNKNTFWGVPSWLDENGEIKKQNLYNEEYVYKPGEPDADLFDNF